jgi:hypothetical protein
MDDWKFKPGQKMSNKNPCHCGSGKPYKNCCKAKDRQEAHASIKSRNLTFAKSIERIRFQSGSPSDWKEIGAFLSHNPEFVKKMHEGNLDLWQNVSFDDIMQDSELSCISSAGELATIYCADAQPDILVNNVKRLSTYVDKIVLIDPFHKPFYYNGDYSPINSPERWVPNTLRMMYFMTFLEPWIRDDVVILVPNPGDFNPKFRDDMEELADHRLKQKPIEIGWDGLKGDYSWLLDFARQIAPESNENIRRILTESWGEWSERHISEFLNFIETIRQTDPLVFRGKLTKRGYLTEWGSGVNAEMHVNLAQYFGAFPSTFSNFEWDMLLSVTEDSETVTKKWLPFTQTLQRLPLPFFDRVDNTVALELRREDYLSPVRDFLRQVWLESGDCHDDKVISEMTRELKSVHDTAIRQSRNLEIDFSRGRWGKLKTNESEVLNDLGLGLAYGLARGLVASPFVPPDTLPKVVAGSLMWSVGRTLLHKVLWPKWRFFKAKRNPAALFFIRLDRSKRL